jgi:hypothetical protein
VHFHAAADLEVYEGAGGVFGKREEFFVLSGHL